MADDIEDEPGADESDAAECAVEPDSGSEGIAELLGSPGAIAAHRTQDMGERVRWAQSRAIIAACERIVRICNGDLEARD